MNCKTVLPVIISFLFMMYASGLKAQFSMAEADARQLTMTGTGAEAIESADIDHDGKPDLAVCFSASSNVNIFLNTSTGRGEKATSFSPALNISYPNGGAYQLNLSDLNRDHLPELIVVNYKTDQLMVFKNLSSPGKIEFSAAQFINCPAKTSTIISCDINMDGYNEIIIACGELIAVFNNTASVNGGDIILEQSATFNLNSTAQDIKCADIDGDGRADIVAGTSTGISILKNNVPQGSKNIEFDLAEGFNIGHSASKIDIGDVDGDFKPDIVTANWPENNFSLIKNISEPAKINFIDAINISASASSEIALTDFDQDGKLDIAANTGEPKLNLTQLYRNISKDNNKFAYAVAQNYIPLMNNIIIDDFDGDGKNDIAGIKNAQNKISVFMNTTGNKSDIYNSLDVYCGEDGKAWLNWSTNVGLTTSSYTIEKTINGREFFNVGSVDATGLNLSENNYSYSDNSPSDQVSFYRIKTIDNKGETVYSNLVELQPCDNALSDFVCVYPNPVDKLMNFHFSIKSAMEMHYEVLNNNMSRQIEKTEMVTPGTRTYTLDISQLPAGTYTLLVQFGNLPAKVCRFEKL